MGKRGRKAQLSRLHEGKRGSSMTSKQNRGGPASPSHPPWLHRNTRAMPSLQTRSFPLSSATLHYPVLSQAQRATAPLSLHYSRAPARSLPTRLTQRPGGVCCPSGIRSHSLLMYTAEARVEGHNQWLPTFFSVDR